MDIGAPGQATLGNVEFEGATKHNRPDLKTGTLIFCRVLDIESDKTRPKLTCISPLHKKNWSSGEAFFKELKVGIVE